MLRYAAERDAGKRVLRDETKFYAVANYHAVCRAALTAVTQTPGGIHEMCHKTRKRQVGFRQCAIKVDGRRATLAA